MSIDFATFDTALKAWVAQELPQASAAAEITDAKRVFVVNTVDKPYQVEIDEPSSIRAIGVDEQTWVDDEENGPICTVVGNRELDVTIRALARTHKANSSACFAIETLRLSLQKPSVLALLSAAGIAVYRIGPAVNYNAPKDERVTSIYAFVLTLGMRFASVDANTSGQVDTVALSSALTLDGLATTVPDVPPNFVDDLIGETTP